MASTHDAPREERPTTTPNHPAPKAPTPEPYPLSLPLHTGWAAPFRPVEPRRFLEELAVDCRRIRAWGGRLVELWTEFCVVDPAYADPAFWAKAAEILRQVRLGATVHLPFSFADLTALDRPAWEGAVRSVETALRAVAPLRPALAAVHPSNYASRVALGFCPDSERPGLIEAMKARLVEGLIRLKAVAGAEALARALALENLPGTPAAFFLPAAREAGVGVCLDVGHSVTDGRDPVEDLGRIREALGPDGLRGFHLHDAVPVTPGDHEHEKAHLPLGSGRLDLRALAGALARFGETATAPPSFGGPGPRPVVLEVVTDGEASAHRAAEAMAGLGSA